MASIGTDVRAPLAEGTNELITSAKGALHIYFKAILQTVCVDHHKYWFWSSLSSL